MQIYSKEQLTAMSDFSVNKLLAELLNPEAEVVRSIAGYEPVSVIENDNSRCMIDYCKNPSDIMPLVFEHNISVIKDVDADQYYACSNFDDKYNDFAWCDNPVHDKNPLRAIACCLILVLQAPARPD